MGAAAMRVRSATPRLASYLAKWRNISTVEDAWYGRDETLRLVWNFVGSQLKLVPSPRVKQRLRPVTDSMQERRKVRAWKGEKQEM